MAVKIPEKPTPTDIPRLQLISPAESSAIPCMTCQQGHHTLNSGEFPRLDTDGRWSKCHHCKARPLNNAQIQDAITITQHDGQALVGACLGSRKTGTSITTANQLRGVWLVVVPAHTIRQWQGAIREWAPQAEVHVINSKNKTGLIDLKEDRGGFSFHIISWETMRARDFSTYKYIDGVILDEVHRMAGRGTASEKAVWKINAKYRIGLSGTPGNNNTYGLYNILHYIWWGNKDHKQRNIFARFAKYRGDNDDPGWLLRHFWVTPSAFGGEFSIDIGPEKRFHSVLDEIPVYIQHLEYETCCEWHPGGVNASMPTGDPIRVIYTDMTPTQAKVYERVSKDTVLWVEGTDGELTPMAIDKKTRRLRQRQVALAVPSVDSKTNKVFMEENAQSGKTDALISLLQDIVEPGEPVVVFTHSRVYANIVVERLRKARELDFPVALWTGGMKDADKDLIIDWFGKDGGPQVIVAVIASIAEGTDGLQANCRREVWLSWDDNPMLNTQASGRLPRTGQKRAPQRWEIATRGTIEQEQVEKLIAARIELETSLRSRQSMSLTGGMITVTAMEAIQKAYALAS